VCNGVELKSLKLLQLQTPEDCQGFFGGLNALLQVFHAHLCQGHHVHSFAFALLALACREEGAGLLRKGIRVLVHLHPVSCDRLHEQNVGLEMFIANFASQNPGLLQRCHGLFTLVITPLSMLQLAGGQQHHGLTPFLAKLLELCRMLYCELVPCL